MNRPLVSAALFAALALVAGCSVIETRSDPSRFYVLEPAAPAPKPESAPKPWPFALAVAEVRVPGYLDRPQIVTRTEGSRVTFSEFHRWPEPLEKGMTRVFSESLAARLGATRLVRTPSLDTWRDGVIVHLDTLRFDGALGGPVTLVSRWRAASVATGETLVCGERTVTVMSESSGYDAYVAALGAALDRLAGEIAAEMLPAVKASDKGLPVRP